MVAGYHHMFRAWEDKPPTPSRQLTGVELELLAPTENGANDFADEAVALGFLAERDGSLDPDNGVEIIGPPLMWPGDYQDGCRWHRLLRLAHDYEMVGWNAGRGYGLHVSLDLRAYGKAAGLWMGHIAKGLKTSCERVAGRRANRWAMAIPYRKYEWGYHLSYGYNLDKYRAVAIRLPHRIEFRMYRSTLLWDGFLRAIEHAHSIAEIASMGVRDRRRLSQHWPYMRWLHLPENKSRFSHLIQALKMPEPPKRQGVSNVSNHVVSSGNQHQTPPGEASGGDHHLQPPRSGNLSEVAERRLEDLTRLIMGPRS